MTSQMFLKSTKHSLSKLSRGNGALGTDALNNYLCTRMRNAGFRSSARFLFTLFSILIWSSASHAQFFNKAPKLLPDTEAFRVTASAMENGTINVSWNIADDYYMYRDKFEVQLIEPNGTQIPADISLKFPQGVIENDPEFGDVEVYFYNANLLAQVATENQPNNLLLLLKGQGCNKPVGVCYPPMQRQAEVSLPLGFWAASAELTETTPSQTEKQPQSITEPSNIEDDKPFIIYLITAFGAGLLLSLTPCVLPMIPILAGVISGQKNPSNARSGWLSICYVAGTVVTYAIAGAIAGATGAQLQAYFQSPLAIGVICTVLFILALSLFGVFSIQMPSAIQTRLNSTSSTQAGGLASLVLGMLSALVVGACVSPVLILALGAAISQGDPVLGASVMASMALGMGVLLIAFGFGAGWLLPKAGAWMKQIQVIFGLMVLAVIAYLLGFFPSIPVLYIWTALLLFTGFYLWHLGELSDRIEVKSLIKACALAVLAWGLLSLFGASQGGRDITTPLSEISMSGNKLEKIPFTRVTSLEQTLAQLSLAKEQSQPVLIDFYADWCLDCVRMQRTTFRDPVIHDFLQNWHLIEIDVTDTNASSEEVKQHFGVFGPPATLTFGRDGSEKAELRQYGYLSADEFIQHFSGQTF